MVHLVRNSTFRVVLHRLGSVTYSARSASNSCCPNDVLPGFPVRMRNTPFLAESCQNTTFKCDTTQCTMDLDTLPRHLQYSGLYAKFPECKRSPLLRLFGGKRFYSTSSDDSDKVNAVLKECKMTKGAASPGGGDANKPFGQLGGGCGSKAGGEEKPKDTPCQKKEADPCAQKKESPCAQKPKKDGGCKKEKGCTPAASDMIKTCGNNDKKESKCDKKPKCPAKKKKSPCGKKDDKCGKKGGEDECAKSLKDKIEEICNDNPKEYPCVKEMDQCKKPDVSAQPKKSCSPCTKKDNSSPPEDTSTCKTDVAPPKCGGGK